MSVPVTIEGQKYFATLPSLADFRTFTAYLAKRRRKNWCAAVPAGLPDAELKRWMRLIDEECQNIDPFKSLGELTGDVDGAALLFHSVLRHENQHVTLPWVTDLVERAADGKPSALDGIRELKSAIQEMLEAKKKELEAQPLPAESPPPSISTPSTSPSAQDTALARAS